MSAQWSEFKSQGHHFSLFDFAQINFTLVSLYEMQVRIVASKGPW